MVTGASKNVTFHLHPIVDPVASLSKFAAGFFYVFINIMLFVDQGIRKLCIAWIMSDLLTCKPHQTVEVFDALEHLTAC